MSSQDISKLSAGEIVQYVYAYSSLILADSKKPITAKSLDAIISASGNKPDKQWASLLEKSFATKNINDLLVYGGGGGGGENAAPAQKDTGKDAAKKEEPKKEEKVEEEEEDFDMGDLFG